MLCGEQERNWPVPWGGTGSFPPLAVLLLAILEGAAPQSRLAVQFWPVVPLESSNVGKDRFSAAPSGSAAGIVLGSTEKVRQEKSAAEEQFAVIPNF